MSCDGEDILNIDIDPDFLISLVGKLSLNNITDISETLQSIEDSVSTPILETQQNVASLSNGTPECSTSTLSKFEGRLYTDHPSSLNLNQKNKDGFLSSIGLFSATNSVEEKSTVLPHDKLIEENSDTWNTLASDSRRNKDSCRPKEKSVKCKNNSCKKRSNKKKCTDSDVQEKSKCDNLESQWKSIPFLSTASFPHKSVNSLQDVFSERGMVYDVQLSDICGSLKLPFLDEEETTTDSSANCLASDLDKTHNLPQLDKSEDLVEKSVCSPDSGIGASPCPSAVSPYSPPTYLEPSDLDCEEYDKLCEDDLEMLLAELIEIENSLRSAEIPQSNANVPVLTDAINPEDQKERILNFLKEPLFNDLKSQLSLLKDEQDRPSFPELVVENCPQSVPVYSSKDTKKISPRSKKHKLGFEFKYAVKSELRHSSIFSKGKHFSERHKILKQIQDDERIQKQVKLIQRLIVSKKLKRTDSDDRENKKRRIELIDSCFKPEQENGY